MAEASKDEPLLKKRVLYIGSAVPLETAEGLDGVQKPLGERYPLDDDSRMEGIVSFISIVKEGITLQHVSDPGRILYFPITSLSLCAAVRCVATTTDGGQRVARFVSISNPAAAGANAKRPAIFTTITRRSEGRKVLECHGFVCSSDKDALELVQFTSMVDRQNKGKLNGAAVPPGQGSESTTTIRPTTVSMLNAAPPPPPPSAEAVAYPEDGDHPIRLVARDSANIQRAVAPELYEPPPEHGYFYTTPDSQIRTYTVERVVEGESERLRAISPNAPTHTAIPTPTSSLSRALPSDKRSVYGGPPPPPPQHHYPFPPPHGYMTMPPPSLPPQGRHLIPIRVMPPPPGAPARPRFFSPPPPMMRPQVMTLRAKQDPYMFMPPPYPVMEPPYMEPQYILVDRPYRRRRSHSSSGASSASSSSPTSHRTKDGQQQQTAVNGDGPSGGGGGSSDGNSRPHTPPTDYDKAPRASRKDQFEHYQRQHLRELNSSEPLHYSTMPAAGGGGGVAARVPQPAHPYGMFMMLPPRHLGYPGYPSYVMERARSVPPHADRGGWQDGGKKSGKSKKDKKKKKKKTKKSGKHHPRGGAPSDYSTDSVGYTSEVGPGGGGDYPRMPRDFRRFENQFKHERAFSKSLKEEGGNRVVPGPVENSGNAYSLNERMAKRRESDFNLY
ncbi:uncharacterized protein LOC143288401 [Babylonia areolata]|uniref:uncharacterized protein LOC143288401 n=1 Tax=Babylonia areolata TaxID=304850 RepID=UPI003FD37247